MADMVIAAMRSSDGIPQRNPSLVCNSSPNPMLIIAENRAID